MILTTAAFVPRPDGLKKKDVVEAVVSAIEAEVTEQSTSIISAAFPCHGPNWLTKHSFQPIRLGLKE